MRDLFYSEHRTQQHGVRARAPTGQQCFNKDQMVSAQNAHVVMGTKAQRLGYFYCAFFQLPEGGLSMRIDHGDRVGELSRVPRDQGEHGTAVTKDRPHKSQDGPQGMGTEKPRSAQGAKCSSNDKDVSQGLRRWSRAVSIRLVRVPKQSTASSHHHNHQGAMRSAGLIAARAITWAASKGVRAGTRS